MTDRRSQLDTLAIVTLVGCCALWGLNHVVTKATLTEIPPLLQAGARSVGAAVLVALWAGARGISLSLRRSFMGSYPTPCCWSSFCRSRRASSGLMRRL